MSEPIILVDVLNTVFRYHYASPKLSFEGTPTSVLHGFLRTILDLREHVSKRIVFCWDHGIPVPGAPRSRNWREDVLPTYKANRARSESWPVICPQLLPLANAINYLGYSNIAVMGLEADDIIGILSQEIKDEILIFSTDKDLYQLLDIDAAMLVPKKDGGKFKRIYAADVEREFGIPVTRWAEYLALGGDHSDNIKPMRGMGPKTAIKLIQAGVDLERTFGQQSFTFQNTFAKYREAWSAIQKSYHAARIPCSWSDPRIKSAISPMPTFYHTQQYFSNQQVRIDGQKLFTRFLADHGLESLLSVRRKFFDDSIPEELPLRQTKTNPAEPTAESITTQNLGIISERALYYHRFLPLHVRRHYEADDMINDCCLHVFRQASEGKYDASKAKPVTWCYHVADNHCKTILSHWASQKYTNYETTELKPLLRFAERDATTPTKRAVAVIEAAVATEVPQMLTEDSVNAVEGVLRHATPWTRELLEQLLCGRLDRVSAPPDKECLYQLQDLAAEHGATLRDFELVRQNYGEAYA